MIFFSASPSSRLGPVSFRKDTGETDNSSCFGRREQESPENGAFARRANFRFPYHARLVPERRVGEDEFKVTLEISLKPPKMSFKIYARQSRL